MLFPETYFHAIDCPGICLKQPGKIEGESVPFIKVDGAFRYQVDRFFQDQATSPFQFIATVKIVNLEKLCNIVLKYADYLNIHCPKVNGFERKQHSFRSGQDHSLAQEPHSGLHFFEVEGKRMGFFIAIAKDIKDARGNAEIKLTLLPDRRINLYFIIQH